MTGINDEISAINGNGVIINDLYLIIINNIKYPNIRMQINGEMKYHAEK